MTPSSWPPNRYVESECPPKVRKSTFDTVLDYYDQYDGEDSTHFSEWFPNADVTTLLEIIVVVRSSKSHPGAGPLFHDAHQAIRRMIEGMTTEELRQLFNSFISTMTPSSWPPNRYVESECPPKVRKSTFDTVLDYYDQYDGEDSTHLSEWFPNADVTTLLEIIVVVRSSNPHPGADPLFHDACQAIRDMIKGKTTEELRQLFNITNDFTPEENAQIEEENVR
ncbi:hypothetical protein C8R44DRAFT_810541 [Mycena epipterygia]|nr:hypothetical protein C8R44DRAFT_810541 [Mycena epipterygia]